MVIEVLVENRTSSPDFSCEHGLSLYIETGKHKILFDMGGSNIFLENAQKMGVDLSLVDIGILSHGHSDHGGGLPAFLALNKNAQIYIHEKADEGHYARRNQDKIAEIGILPQVMEAPKVIRTKGDWQVDDGLLLFSTVNKSSFALKQMTYFYVKMMLNILRTRLNMNKIYCLSKTGKRF